MVDEQRFISPDEVETIEFDWGKSKWLSTPDVTGAENFSAGVVVLGPGQAHERHTHPDSEEILYFLGGTAEQMIDDETREMSEGDLVHIPAGVEHSTKNTGWEPLRFLAVYGPPGPESELADMEGSSIIPPGEAAAD